MRTTVFNNKLYQLIGILSARRFHQCRSTCLHLALISRPSCGLSPTLYLSVASITSLLSRYMTSRRPLSIQELAARSRPTGYDPSKSFKDLLCIATAESDAGEQAKSTDDLESAFIHYARASALLLEDFPTHPKFAEFTSFQKDTISVASPTFIHISKPTHGQLTMRGNSMVKLHRTHSECSNLS
jgi:hypothetical protein